MKLPEVLIDFVKFSVQVSLRVAQYPYLIQQASYSTKITQEGFIKLTKRTLVSYLILFFVISGTGLIYLFNPFGTKSAEAAWFNDNWSYRKALTIDGSKVSGSSALTDFPVLVSLSSDSSLGSNAKSDGSDIRFTDISGNVLDYEIESYSVAGGNGTLIAWVRIPSLTPAVNTVIYIYYGNPSASTTQRFGKVWDSNYQLVQHMGETSAVTTTLSDSTTYRNYATKETANIPAPATGKIGGSQSKTTGTTTADVTVANASPPSGTSNFTFDFWVNPDLSGNFFAVDWGFNGSSIRTITLQIITTGAPKFLIGNSSTLTSSSTISSGTYSHVVLTRSGNTYTFYVNGVAAGSTTNSTSLVFNSCPMHLFASMNNGTDCTTNPNSTNNIALDELRYSLDVARSSDYIATEYNNESAPSTFFSTGSEEKAPSPTSYWKFDEGQGTTVQDSMSTNYDISLSGTPVWQTEDLCLSSKCLIFDGTNDVGSVSGFASTFFTGNWTQSLWIKTTQAGNKVLSEKGTNQAFIQTNDGQIRAGTTGGAGDFTDTTGAPLVTDGSWHNVTVTYDASTNALVIYIDGIRRGGTTTNNDTSSSATAYSIGARSGATVLYAGQMDEVKVYNFTLSSSQVVANFNARSNPEGVSQQQGNNVQNMPAALSNGLVGYWKLDEASGQTKNCTATPFTDSSGNGYNGKSCPSTTGPDGGASGKFGNAVDFDNSNDYISTGNTTNYTSFTAAAWFNADATSADDTILSKNDYTGSNNGFYLRNAQGTLQAGIQNGGTEYNSSLSSGVTAGTWIHAVLTFDGTTMKLYKNGVLADSDAATISTNTQDFKIGAAYQGDTEWFDGKIDDVRYYNRALSGTEVAQLANWAPGPVGYWKMEDTATTAAAATLTDSSGQGNNLTTGRNSGNYPITTGGKYGGAFDPSSNVEDTNRWANIADGPAALDQTGPITLMGWLKPYSASCTSTGGTIVSKGLGAATFTSSTQLGYRLNYGCSGGTVQSASFTVTSDGTDDNETSISSGIISMPDNTWHHIAGVYSGSQLLIYVDGVLKASSSYSSGIFNNTANFTIGGLQSGGGGGLVFDLAGMTDDVKLYNYARTTAQIIEDMNAGHPAPGSPVGTPLGYWKMDEGYGTTANNSGSGGSGSAGTITGSPAWTDSAQYGKGLVFDGTNNKYVSIPGTGALQDVTDGSFTMSVWAKPTALPTNSDSSNNIATVISRNGFHTDISYTTTQQYYFEMWNTTPTNFNTTSTKTYPINTWHHLAGVVNTSDNTVKLYVDGILQGSTTFTGTPRDYTTANYYLGKTGTGACTVNFTWCFTGSIDEAKIYASALTAEQVKLDYNRGQAEVLGALSDNSSHPVQAANQEYCIPGDSTTCTAPVGRWDFEEGTGTTAQDSSGNSNTGTITPGVGGYVTGKTGKGYNFDNADTLINAGSGSSLDDLPAAGMTIEAWVYPKSTGGEGGTAWVVAKAANGNGDSGWYLATTTNGRIILGVDAATTDLSAQTASSTVTANAWQHIVVTWTGDVTNATTAKFYVNGQLKSHGSDINGVGTRTSDATSSLTIGNVTAQSRTFNGPIDQVRVFNYVRTPTQVAWDYNKGGPTGYWKMDECQGTTINDSSGNNYSGTWSGSGSGTYTSVGTCTTSSASSAWYNGVSGKKNYSMAFDGTDDLVSIGTNSVIGNLTSNFSVSAWVKPTVVSDGSSHRIFGSSRTSTTNGWALGIYQAGLIFSSWGVKDYGSTGITLSTNNWYYVTAVMDSSFAVTFYVNGVKYNTVTNGSGAAANTDDPIYIGATTAGSSTPTENFGGQIDDVKVFNYALTDTQVKTLYNQGTVNYGPTTGAP